jgi:hypothetical protein
VKGSRIEPPEPETVSAERAGGHDLQTVRSVREVVERLGVGLVGVGMIESRDDPPGTAGSKGSRTFRRRIDRFDPNAVRGLRYERFEARTLERDFGGSGPIGLSGSGKRTCDCAQRRVSLDELGEPRNRRRDFSDDLIARRFASIAENFFADCLDLLHPEAEA